jgi:hypothetical protein
VRITRLIWIDRSRLVGVATEVDDGVLARGAIEPDPASGFPGPAGRYHLLGEEFWRTMEPEDPAPTFLHESYEALLEKWVNSLPDAAAEVTIVARVRDAVMQLVESRLAADPRAISASPTVTTTEPTRQGMAVVGRSVVLRPSRSRPRPASDPAEERTPRRPGCSPGA